MRVWARRPVCSALGLQTRRRLPPTDAWSPSADGSPSNQRSLSDLARRLLPAGFFHGSKPETRRERRIQILGDGGTLKGISKDMRKIPSPIVLTHTHYLSKYSPSPYCIPSV